MTGMETAIKTNPQNPPNKDWVLAIEAIIKRGNVAEVKKEKDNIVVVEIKRQVKNKTAIIGQGDTANRGYRIGKTVYLVALFDMELRRKAEIWLEKTEIAKSDKT